jgi:bifunctional UDP-N-acetylglucosamine pyrophosphorylase/glucosamine-1-phosphate N-acetyltransferase
MNENVSVVILAAGLGTRMKSKRAKVLHRAGGLALIEHVSRAAQRVIVDTHHEIGDLESSASVVAVTGHQAEEVEKLLAPMGLRFARQTEQKGTGHALACAREALPDHDGLLMVLYGDVPLLSAETLVRLRDLQANSNAAATLITTTLDDPSGYGRVITDSDGNVQAIVEHKACTPGQLAIKVINSGIYCFRAELLWKHIGEIQPDNPAHEYYLTDMAQIFARHGLRVQSMHVEDPAELLGINTRIELADADRILRRRKTDELMLSGVTIERPETVSIDTCVRVGRDTVIEPFARLVGSTEVGEDCHICSGAILESSTLGNGVLIRPYCVITESRIESDAQLGPFSRLRPGADIGRNAHIGNFVEIKKTRIGARSKAQHLAYLGDSIVGEGVNIGAGTITCNYDGERKHKTEIGDRAFVGTNSTLVAPVEIGADSYIGAGSVITDTVPPGALALGRGRQVNKEGWVAARKKKRDSK